MDECKNPLLEDNSHMLACFAMIEFRHYLR